jgi:hypothetical protein
LQLATPPRSARLGLSILLSTLSLGTPGFYIQLPSPRSAPIGFRTSLSLPRSVPLGFDIYLSLV